MGVWLGGAAVGSASAAVAWPAGGDGADGGAQILEYVLTLETLMDDEDEGEEEFFPAEDASSSDEEDDILQNLKQQAQRGTRSSASYDPDASSNFGKTTASSDGTPNFESMRDAFREAGMEALETKSPVAAPPTVASAAE